MQKSPLRMCRNPALMMDPPKKMHLAPHPFRYFPVTDAEDSCSGDQCSCTVDGESYTVDQGRVQLETTSSSESKDMMPAAGEGRALAHVAIHKPVLLAALDAAMEVAAVGIVASRR